MQNTLLVLNAGSSSVKFSVFERPQSGDWRLDSRGQIEGIGTSPRLLAKDGGGVVLVRQDLDGAVSDGNNAMETLAAWLKSRYGGNRLVGVGHRIVHGGT